MAVAPTRLSFKKDLRYSSCIYYCTATCFCLFVCLFLICIVAIYNESLLIYFCVTNRTGLADAPVYKHRSHQLNYSLGEDETVG